MFEQADLHEAYIGSYYTICGAGGALEDWSTGIQEVFTDRGIGTVTEWYQTTGGAINDFAGARGNVTNPFKDDLTVIMFPLTGLNQGMLAIAKLMAGDRWFDDLVDNMLDRDEFAADMEDEEA